MSRTLAAVFIPSLFLLTSGAASAQWRSQHESFPEVQPPGAEVLAFAPSEIGRSGASATAPPSPPPCESQVAIAATTLVAGAMGVVLGGVAGLGVGAAICGDCAPATMVVGGVAGGVIALAWAWDAQQERYGCHRTWPSRESMSNRELPPG